jgi:hypothetical protein
MLLSERLTEQSFFTRENISAQYNRKDAWNWPIPFLWLPHVPEMLIQGKEEEFWSYFMKAECYNSSAFNQAAVNEWVRCSKASGGLKGILGMYRSHWINVYIEKEIPKKGRLECRVMVP